MWVKLLTKIKKQRGWTSYEMASRLGISQTQLNHYEKKPPGTRELIIKRLRELSGMSIDDFWREFMAEVADVEARKIADKIAKLKRKK